MMPTVLLVGCPPAYADWLPEGAVSVLEDAIEPGSTPRPALIVVGPDADRPTLVAQRLARRFVGAGLVIATREGAIGETLQLLNTTPYVPLGTRVVGDDAAQLREAVAQLMRRWRADRARAEALAAARNELARLPDEGRSVQRPERRADVRSSRVRERLYSSVVEGSSDAILSLSPDGKITAWNQGAEQLYGYPADEAVGSDITLIAPPDKRGELSRILARLQEGESFTLETVRVGRDGRRLDVSITVSPIHDDDGAIVGGSAIARDIGERIRAERTLAERTDELEGARRDYADLYENAPDMYVSVDAETGTISRANRTLHERLGFTEGSLRGRPVFELYHPDSREHAAATLEQLRERGAVRNVRLVLQCRDGSTVPVLLNVTAVRDEDGRITGTRSLLRDISDVADLEARKAAMLHAARDAIVTMDASGAVVEYNPAAEHMFGYSADEAVGTGLADLIIPPRLRERHLQGLRRCVETGEGSILGRRLELAALRKDGSELPVELIVVQLAGMDPPLFTGFIRDLTDLKAAQEALKQTIEELRRSNQGLEQFAYVASHDLQEPLRMVVAYMDLLERRHAGQLDDEARQFIGFAADGARRMRTLVDDLLEYAQVGRGPKDFKPCDCEEVLDAVLETLRVMISEVGASVTRTSLPKVLGDRAQLEHVFQNLIDNALKYRREQAPTVHVESERVGEMWELVVADNGTGFDESQGGRIFQMFQRLHEGSDRPGTGIGLAVAKRIVEQHGGRIWAHSVPGSGSRFHFTLRAATHRSGPRPA